jgi:hypothetical protein
LIPARPLDPTWTWKDNQEFERAWHDNCVNSFAEETKQISYAHRMGLVMSGAHLGKWPAYDLEGKSILDIGGGPYSLLLKCFNHHDSIVVDPCDYPAWVKLRYEVIGVRMERAMGETLDSYPFLNESYDEVWMYNVLQHVDNPEAIIKNARAKAKVIRYFDWANMPPHEGHPQMLVPDQLNEWFGQTGTVEQMNGENGCDGLAYYGVFRY